MPGLPNYQSDSYNELADYERQPQSSFSDVIGAKFQRGVEYGVTKLGLNNLDVNARDGSMYKGYDENTGDPIPNFWMNSADAKKKYGVSINADQKISESAAQRISELKAQDKTREDIINHASQDFGTQSLGFGAEMAATLLDPINVGSMFVPIVGEARGFMLMERFGPTVGRLLTGAAEGAISQAVLELPTYGLAQRLNYDYDIYDSFLNVAAGGIIGGGLHAGLGKIGDILGISDWANRVETGRISPETHHNMIRTAVGEALQDQKVKVEPVYREHILNKFNKDPELLKDIMRYLSDENYRNKILSSLEDTTSKKTNVSMIGEMSDKNDIRTGKATKLTAEEMKDFFSNFNNQEKLKNKIVNLFGEQENTYDEIVDEFGEHNTPSIDPTFAEKADTKNMSISDIEQHLSERKQEMLRRENMGAPKDFISGLKTYIDEVQAHLTSKIDEKNNLIDKANSILSAIDDINNSSVEKMTNDQLLDEMANYHSLEGKWYYDPKIGQEMDANLKDAPSQYTDVEAQKSLDDIMSKVDPESLPDLEKFDENISLSNKIGEAIKSAASCIIKELF